MTQQNATFWGIETCVHLVTKFYHAMFNRLEVIVLTTNKPQTNNWTPLKTCTSFRYAAPVGNH